MPASAAASALVRGVDAAVEVAAADAPASSSSPPHAPTTNTIGTSAEPSRNRRRVRPASSSGAGVMALTTVADRAYDGHKGAASLRRDGARRRRAAMSPARPGGRTVEPVTEEDF